MELKKQMERLFEAVDDYLIKRETASDEVKRILDSVLEEFKLPLCRLEKFWKCSARGSHEWQGARSL